MEEKLKNEIKICYGSVSKKKINDGKKSNRYLGEPRENV